MSSKSWADICEEEEEVVAPIPSTPIVQEQLPHVYFVFSDEWNYTQSPFQFIGYIEEPTHQKLLDFVKKANCQKWFHAFDVSRKRIIYRARDWNGKTTGELTEIAATEAYVQRNRSIPKSAQRKFPALFPDVKPLQQRRFRRHSQREEEKAKTTVISTGTGFDVLAEGDEVTVD